MTDSQPTTAPQPEPLALSDALRSAVNAAVEALPRSLQPYASEIARATLAQQRAHGQKTPQPPPSLGVTAAVRARLAVDAACDRLRTAHLREGMRVTVRCWPDEAEREGTITSIQPGASAPVAVLVDYPDGYHDPAGLEPINPSAYPLQRIVLPPSPLRESGLLHRVEHELGEPGKGLWLPGAGILTWRVDPDGSPPALTMIDRLDLAAAWRPHPDGRALAFAITPSGGLTTQDASALSVQESRWLCEVLVLGAAEAEYVRRGYMTTGAIGADACDARHAQISETNYLRGLDGLVERGELRRRHCRAVRYELPPDRKMALIDEHHLDQEWERTAAAFYPNQPTWGEIPRVRAYAGEERHGCRSTVLRVYYPGDRGGDAREGMLALELELDRTGVSSLELVAVWRAARRPASATLPPVAAGEKRVAIALDALAMPRLQGALLAEVERVLRASYKHGGELEQIVDSLADTGAAWLREHALERLA